MNIPNNEELTQRVWSLWGLFDLASISRSGCKHFKHNKPECWIGFTLNEDFIQVKYKSITDNEFCEIIVNDEVRKELPTKEVPEYIEKEFNVMVESFI